MEGTMGGLNPGRARFAPLVRGLVVRTVSLAFGVMVGVALAEGCLRLFSLAPIDGLATVTEAEFRSVPGLLSPNQDLTDRRIRALPHHVAVNALGYRGPELPPQKATGEIRLLMAGDSFTYGEFVNDDETLPAQLEQQLRQRCGPVRVINAGIGGTTIDTHARLIERGLSLRPDAVILTFSENDLDDLADISAWDRFASNRAMKSRFPLSVVYPVLRQSALWNFSLEARARLKGHMAVSAAGSDVEVVKTQRRGIRLRLRDVYARALTSLRDHLQADRVAFAFVLFPSHFSLWKNASNEQLDWMMQMGRDGRITTLNLLDPLRESGQSTNRLYLLPNDGHPSPRGYAVAAKALAQVVARDALHTACSATLSASPTAVTQ
jgi:lysophospholipase L1-like esterase